MRGIAVGVLDKRYTTSRVSVVHNRIVDAGSNASPGALHYPLPSACRETFPRLSPAESAGLPLQPLHRPLQLWSLKRV